MSRTHDIHGSHGRLSLKTIQEFFPLLKRRRWAKAEKILELTVKKLGEDEWIKGYVHALDGMITTLKTPHSSPLPYIIKLKGLDKKRLLKARETFNELVMNLTPKSKFDAGYFQAWNDFLHYKLHLMSSHQS